MLRSHRCILSITASPASRANSWQKKHEQVEATRPCSRAAETFHKVTEETANKNLQGHPPLGNNHERPKARQGFGGGLSENRVASSVSPARENNMNKQSQTKENAKEQQTPAGQSCIASVAPPMIASAGLSSRKRGSRQQTAAARDKNWNQRRQTKGHYSSPVKDASKKSMTHHERAYLHQESSHPSFATSKEGVASTTIHVPDREKKTNKRRQRKGPHSSPSGTFAKERMPTTEEKKSKKRQKDRA